MNTKFASGTLSRKLMLRVIGLVALVAVALSATTVLVTYRLLDRQLDDRLQAVSSLTLRGAGRIQMRRGIVDLPGLPDGTLVAHRTHHRVLAVVIRDGEVQPIADQSTQGILAVEPGKRTEITVGDYGKYRIQAAEGPVGRGMFVGLPVQPVTDIMLRVLAVTLGATLLAIGLAAFVTRRVVVSSLRPLRELADVATDVSNRELDKGDPHLEVRARGEAADAKSEVGQVGLALNHMLDNLSVALETRNASEEKLRRFVADASHELRNPLAAITGYAELSRRNASALPQDVAHALERIDSESARMSTLVNDLLLLSRLDAEMALDLQPTDLSEIAINAVSDASAADRTRNWRLKLPEQPVCGMADRARLHQVLANLLANVRGHTPPGATATVLLRSAGQEAIIEVADDGPGIPPALLPRVFERFARGDESRARGESASTGLGLAIVAAVVAAHHGRVQVTSVPGNTVFQVTLRSC